MLSLTTSCQTHLKAEKFNYWAYDVPVCMLDRAVDYTRGLYHEAG